MDDQTDCLFVSSIGVGNESIQVYDAKTGANIKSYRGVPASPKTLSFIGSKDYVMNAQFTKSFLQIWNLNKNDPLVKHFPVPGKVNVLDVNEFGPKYCVMGIKEKIYPYNLLYGAPFGVISRHYQDVTCIKFTSCGRYFASAGKDGFVFLWSIASLEDSLIKSNQPQIEPYYILGQHSHEVVSLTIAQHERRSILASASKDSSIKVFDLVTGLLRHNLPLNRVPTCILFNSLGSELYFGSSSGTVHCIKLLPIPDQENVEVKDTGIACHDCSITCLSLAENSNMLITGCDEGDVKVFKYIENNLGSSGKPSNSLVFKRLLQQGKGKVTGLICKRLPREVFNVLELDSQIVIGEFHNKLSKDVTDLAVNVPIKGPKRSIPGENLDRYARIWAKDTTTRSNELHKNKRPQSDESVESNKKAKKEHVQRKKVLKK